MVKTHFNLHVQTIRSDNAFELGSSAKASSFFAEFGILHQTTIPHIPQQNGGVERKHKHLLETSRALLFQSNLPNKYWGDCVLTATYLINRFPSTVLQNLSPYHKLHGHPPTYTHLRTFGSLCFATIPKVKRDKLQPRASPSLFLGYPLGKKGYKLLDLANHSIFYSRDVVFHEHIFPYHSSSPPFGFPAISNPFVDSQASSYSPLSFAPPHSPIQSSHLLSQSSPHSLNQSSSHPSSPPLIPTAQPLPLRKSTRVSHAPTYLKDYICSSVQLPAFLPSEPRYYQQAAPHPAWQEAMEREFQALMLTPHGTLCLFHLGKRQSLVNGCTKSNKSLMVPLKGIRLD